VHTIQLNSAEGITDRGIAYLHNAYSVKIQKLASLTDFGVAALRNVQELDVSGNLPIFTWNNSILRVR
jgi:tRNA U38,U39,U40 pseudouridine synthase TruA